MSHVFQIPDEIYQELTNYATSYGKTPEAIFLEWVADIRQKEIASQDALVASVSDPWAGFLTQATAPDVTTNHDYYLGEDALDPHDYEK